MAKPKHLRDIPSGDLCRISVWVRPGSHGGKGRTVWARVVSGDVEGQPLYPWPADSAVLDHRPRKLGE